MTTGVQITRTFRCQLAARIQVLDEAGMEDAIPFEEEAGTSSRLHPLQRPKFGELPAYARPGDTVRISEMFRLVRGTGPILDVLNVLHRDRSHPAYPRRRVLRDR